MSDVFVDWDKLEKRAKWKAHTNGATGSILSPILMHSSNVTKVMVFGMFVQRLRCKLNE